MNKERIKVLFRIKTLEMGGVQRVMLDIMKYLPKDKFEIALLTNLYQGNLRNDVPEGIKFIYLAKGKEDFSKNKFLNKIQLILRRLKLLAFERVPTIFYPLKFKNDYDIEIASSYTEFDGVLNSSNKKSKKIAWFHTDVSNDKNKERVKERIHKLLKFDHVVFCAKHLPEVISRDYGIEYPNSTIINNAIHINEVREKANETEVDYDNLIKPVFCSIGRLFTSKGYHLLIPIHSRLLKEGYLHSVVILGEGSEQENLLNQIKQEGVGGSFKLLGNKNNPFPYLKNADFFILPTANEAYPLVINEALVLEKPIISTNVGAIPDMVENNKEGILVNNEAEEIYQAMKKFLSDSDLVNNFKDNLKNSYTKFDSQKIYDQITELLQNEYNLHESPNNSSNSNL